MTSRVAAQKVSQAAIDAMAKEWDTLQHNFEPDRREDFKAWVWDLVRTRLVGVRTLPPPEDQG